MGADGRRWADRKYLWLSLRDGVAPAALGTDGKVATKESLIPRRLLRLGGPTGGMPEVKGRDGSDSDGGGETRAVRVDAARDVVILEAVHRVFLVVAVDGTQGADAQGVVGAEDLGLVRLGEPDREAAQEELPLVAPLACREKRCRLDGGESLEGIEAALSQQQIEGDALGRLRIQIEAVPDDQLESLFRHFKVACDCPRRQDYVAVDGEDEVAFPEKSEALHGSQSVVAGLIDPRLAVERPTDKEQWWRRKALAPGTDRVRDSRPGRLDKLAHGRVVGVAGDHDACREHRLPGNASDARCKVPGGVGWDQQVNPRFVIGASAERFRRRWWGH